MNLVEKRSARDALSIKEELEELITRGTCALPLQMNELAIKDIELMPDLFQPRSTEQWQSEGHISGLMSLIARHEELGSGKIPPILVYWVGDQWVCIDGHHRIEAFRGRYGRQSEQLISVEVFEGPLNEAILESNRRNSKNKLPMTVADKTERAWCMLLLDVGTYQSIADACGVSTKSIQRMAKAKRELTHVDLHDLRWWQVRMYLHGVQSESLNTAEQIHAGRPDISPIRVPSSI